MTNDWGRLSTQLFSLSKSNPNTVLLKSIEGCALPTKPNLISLENINDDEKISKFLSCYCFSDSDVQAIEKMTRPQSKSSYWKVHKKVRLTISKHHDVFTKVKTLAKHKSSYSPKVKHEAIRWGNDHEEHAARAFYALEATKHFDFKAAPARLFADKTRPYIDVLPDKIMNCKYHGKSAVVIKCPHKIWNKTIKDNFKYLDILTLNTNDNISVNNRHKYYTQNNSQMVLGALLYGQQMIFSWTKLIKVSINLEVRLKIIL